MRPVVYCAECGGRVYGLCSRCHFDLTGEDEDERREVEAPPRVEGPAE